MNIDIEDDFIDAIECGPIEHNRLFIDADRVIGVVVSTDICGSDGPIKCDYVIWFTNGNIIASPSTIKYPIRYF